jgi:DNA-binding response OmpR family regulator
LGHQILWNQATSTKVLVMLKVLIVEDDFMIADCLEEILEEAGYEVCGIASKVDEAIRMGEEHRPDLAVIDLRLASGGYGTEVASALCVGGGLGVLYVTGNADHPMLVDACGEGCMSKPYSTASILAALRIVTERMSKLTILSRFPADFRLLRA